MAVPRTHYKTTGVPVTSFKSLPVSVVWKIYHGAHRTIQEHDTTRALNRPFLNTFDPKVFIPGGPGRRLDHTQFQFLDKTRKDTAGKGNIVLHGYSITRSHSARHKITLSSGGGAL